LFIGLDSISDFVLNSVGFFGEYNGLCIYPFDVGRLGRRRIARSHWATCFTNRKGQGVVAQVVFAPAANIAEFGGGTAQGSAVPLMLIVDSLGVRVRFFRA
jgi:hypothetical protein